MLDTTAFSDGGDRATTERDLIWFLESLVQRDVSYLIARPNTPRLYKSGVVWQKPAQFNGDVEEVAVLRRALGSAARKGDVKRALALVQEVLGGERFRDIGRVLENGGGDCDNLNTWRCAELRQAGIPARPMMTSRSRIGGTTYHAIVRWPPFGDALSGNPFMDSDEDPSLLLGMSQPQRKAERDIEIAKNLERCDYIRRYKAQGGPARGINLDAVLEDVLGLRRYANPTFEAQIEQLFNGARA